MNSKWILIALLLIIFVLPSAVSASAQGATGIRLGAGQAISPK
jgi:hypothetical protein